LTRSWSRLTRRRTRTGRPMPGVLPRAARAHIEQTTIEFDFDADGGTLKVIRKL